MIPKRRFLVMAAVVSLAIAVSGWAASGALASNRIYWTNVANNTITFANLDGSGGFGTLDTSPVTPSLPEGVAMDPAGGKVYWANETGSIMFANLSGGGGGVLNTTGANLDWPFGVALDLAHGRIYWANAQATAGEPGISWANLNGTGGGNLNTAGATVEGPIGVTIDPAAGRIYWSNWSDDVISYASLNGSGGGDLPTAGAAVTHPEGGAIDPSTGRLFFSDERGAAISFANLRGSGGGELSTGQATVNIPSGVAIDPFAGKLYWANQNGGAISSANLDGSGGADLNIAGSPSNNASMPALLEAPRGAGAPAVSQSSSVLSCSQGSWGSDLNAQQLYQAPQTFAYSWTENGRAMPGAATNSITATTPGKYACTVTATNQAGSTSQTSAGFVLEPPLASVRLSTNGPIAFLTFTCKGAEGLTCAGRFTVAGHKHTVHGAPRAVTARKAKPGKHTTVAVPFGRGSYSLHTGHRSTVRFTLNAAGKRLLARLHKVGSTINFAATSGTPIRKHQPTFKFGRVTSPIAFSFSSGGSFSTVKTLLVTRLPAGATVTVACHGGGCPFTQRSFGHKSRVDLAPAFGGAHLSPGTRIVIVISAPFEVSKVATFRIHR